MKYTCPACGYLTFHEPPGSFDICAICGWEDDESQLKFPNNLGANNVSLIQAQKNYKKLGYSTRNLFLKLFIKRKESNYKKDQEWRALTNNDKVEEPISGLNHENSYPEDMTQLYYWKKSP